jgi:hypothetical protein
MLSQSGTIHRDSAHGRCVSRPVGIDWRGPIPRWLTKAIRSIFPNADLSGPDVEPISPSNAERQPGDAALSPSNRAPSAIRVS